MIRGTTPTFTLTLSDKEDVDLTEANYDYLSQVTVAAIPYVETANTYGTTVTIG